MKKDLRPINPIRDAKMAAAFDKGDIQGAKRIFEGKPKIISDVSDEALVELFHPAYSENLNCSLGEYVLRLLAVEYTSRGGKKTEPSEEAFHGPANCHHGRSRMGYCGACEAEETAEDGPEAELSAFCDAYREGRPFDKRRLFEAIQMMGYGLRKRDPEHDQNAPCARSGCGHTYDRHFDPYEDDREVGCKYCGHFKCGAFIEPTEGREVTPAEPGGLHVHLAQPVGVCDGTKRYAYDPKAANGRGAKLKTWCPGCRACQ